MQGGMPKAQLMAGDAMNRALIRMAHEMMEQLDPIQEVVFVGIRRRGVPLAQRLADIIARYEDVALPVGEVDIAMYRDDRDPSEVRISVQEKNRPRRHGRHSGSGPSCEDPSGGADRQGTPGAAHPPGLCGQERAHGPERTCRRAGG